MRVRLWSLNPGDRAAVQAVVGAGLTDASGDLNSPDTSPSSHISRFAPYVLALLIWGTIQALRLGPVLDDRLVDTDSYMRLIRVMLLRETADWFDSAIVRSNAPYGHTMHWTRPFDVVLLLGGAMAAPWVGFRDGLFWAGAFVSPVLQLITIFTLAWAAKPLLGVRRAPFVMLAFLVQPAALLYNGPGQADHHSLLLLLLVISLGLTIRLLLRAAAPRLALLTGAVAGLGVWVSVEFLPLVALTAAVLSLSSFAWGGDRSRLNLRYAAGFTAVVAVATMTERPPGDWLAVEYDKVSIVYLAVALTLTAVWAAAWLFDRSPAPRSPRQRLAALAVGAVMGAIVLYVIFPNLFPIWLDHVAELQPLLSGTRESLSDFLLYLGPSLIAIPFAALLVWRRRRLDDWPAWLFLGLVLGVIVASAIDYRREIVFAGPFLAVFLSRLLVPIRERLAFRSVPLRAVARASASFTFLFGFVILGLVIRFSFGASSGSTGAERPSCDVRPVAVYLADPTAFGERPRNIAAMIDYGPELLYRTEHSVLSTPYHRNTAGILDASELFGSPDGARSKAIIAERRIELLLIYPGSGGSGWSFGRWAAGRRSTRSW